jgi:hypothetical protein
MARRSKSVNVLSKSKRILNKSVSGVDTILRKSSNFILGLGNKAFRTLKTKKRKSKHSRRR